MSAEIAPLINGMRYSYSSIEVSQIIGVSKSQIFPDVYGVKYSEKLNVSFVRGTSRAPIGWTAGTWEPGDASIIVGKETFQTNVVEVVGPGWMGVGYVMNVSYSDVNAPFSFDTLVARIVGVDEDHALGPDGLQSLITLKPISMLRNGIPSLLNGSVF